MTKTWIYQSNTCSTEKNDPIDGVNSYYPLLQKFQKSLGPTKIMLMSGVNDKAAQNKKHIHTRSGKSIGNKNLRKIEKLPIFTGSRLDCPAALSNTCEEGAGVSAMPIRALPAFSVQSIDHQISRTGCRYPRITCSAGSRPKSYMPVKKCSRLLRTTHGEAGTQATMREQTCGTFF